MSTPTRRPAQPIELPVVEGQRAERADAARNRIAILSATERLLARRPAEEVTMDDVAAEAGVGKGTLFRRFGDRAGLFHALLDDSDRRLQEGFIRGPAPLGPGAPPIERLVAFGEAVLARTEERGAILLAALPADRRHLYHSTIHGAYRAHVRILLTELVPDQAEYLAEALLACLMPELVLHQRSTGMTLAQLQDSWGRLVRGLLS